MARRKKTITGAELFCRSLVKEGVTYLFGYTGGAIMPVYDAFPKFPQLKHIMVRHEQAAAFAAQGDGACDGETRGMHRHLGARRHQPDDGDSRTAPWTPSRS